MAVSRRDSLFFSTDTCHDSVFFVVKYNSNVCLSSFSVLCMITIIILVAPLVYYIGG